MAKPARRREAVHLERDLPPPPAVRRRAARDLERRRWPAARARGRRRPRDRQRRRAGRHGRAHAARRGGGAGPAAVRGRRGARGDRRRPARAALGDAPRHRDDDGRPRRLHHLPRRPSPARPYRLDARPRRRQRRARDDAARRASPRALGVAALRIFETGGDRFEAEREQWDDGNNVLAVAPGVVVAYERNVDTNTAPARARASRSSPSPAPSSAAAAAARAACAAPSTATPSRTERRHDHRHRHARTELLTLATSPRRAHLPARPGLTAQGRSRDGREDRGSQERRSL